MRFLLALAAVVMTGLGAMPSASAADVPGPVGKAPMYGVPIQSWTGFYLGINTGGISGSWDIDPLGGSFGNRGWVYGIQAGYLWQTGRLVLGLEADIDGTTLNGRGLGGCGPLGCEGSNRWISTVRGRAGIAVESFLPYLTGGLAFGDLRVSNNFTGAAISAQATGYAIGGGLEFPLAGRWTARGEYLFVDLRDIGCPGAVCGVPAANSRASFNANMYRAGVNFRF